MSRAFSGTFWAILVIGSRNWDAGRLVARLNFDEKVDSKPENRENTRFGRYSVAKMAS
jgi:hypothetical protein